MSRRRFGGAVLCVLALLFSERLHRGHFAAHAGEPAESPRAAEIKVLIERLGSSDFKQREGALERLRAIGDDALPYLERAAKDPDAERAFAAKSLLDVMRWKLPPRLEALLEKPLEDYPKQSVTLRQQALELVSKYPVQARSLAPFLSNVARFDPEPTLRLRGLDLYIALTPDGDPLRDELILESMETDPLDAPKHDVHLAKARLLVRLDRNDKAIAEARKALAAKPDLQASLFLVDVLLKAGDPKEALALLEKLVAAAPADVELKARLGEAYLLTGEMAKGEEVLNAIAKDVKDKNVLLRVARAWLRVKRPDDARQVVDKALARAPYDHDVNVALAELDLGLGRSVPALRRFLNEARYTQRESEALKRVRAGITSVLTGQGYGDVAEDDDIFEDARRGRPIAAAREREGRFLLARGLVVDAARAFRVAAAFDPDGVDVRLRLGDALRRAGKDDDAKKVYSEARALAPQDGRVTERLRAIALGTPPEGGVVPMVDAKADITAWDRRVLREELKGEPEAVASTLPPPVCLDGLVVVAASGTTPLFALDPKEGVVRWKVRLEDPKPPEGIAKDRVGLEIAGLVAVPAAACGHVDPKRARDARPLVAVLANEWIRAPGRSWRKASFHASLAVLVDPVAGKVLDATPIFEEPFISAPVGRGSRVLVVTQVGEGQAALVLLDLVARKARWKQQLSGAAGKPIFAGELAVVPFAGGVAAFAASGDLAFAFAEKSPTTGVVFAEGALWFGASDTLVRLPVDGKTAQEVAKLDGEPLGGDLAVLGSRVFAASRGGAIRAFDSAGKLVGSFTPAPIDRAASRTLIASNGRLFAQSGVDDAFKDEMPSLLALDPATLGVVWRRPVDRPAALAVASDGLVVAVSGGVGSPGGLRVVGARAGGAAVDARPRLLAELRAAAEDAIADGEPEIAVLIARRYIAARGGLSLLGFEDLMFVARALGKSRRNDDAESIFSVAAARDASPEAAKKIEELRKELKLIDEPDKKDEPKKDDKGDAKKDEPKPGEPKKDEPKPEEPKKDEPKKEEPKAEEPKKDEPKKE